MGSHGEGRAEHGNLHSRGRKMRDLGREELIGAVNSLKIGYKRYTTRFW